VLSFQAIEGAASVAPSSKTMKRENEGVLRMKEVIKVLEK